MGTISIDNSGVEKRLESVESKVSENTGVLSLGFNSLYTKFSNTITQLRILNLHQEVITNEKFTEQDVDNEN